MKKITCPYSVLGSAILIILALNFSSVRAQQYKKVASLKNDPKIELQIKTSPDACSGDPTPTYFGLYVNSLNSKYQSPGATLTLTIEFKNCRGVTERKVFPPIDLGTLKNGLNTNPKWKCLSSEFLSEMDVITPKQVDKKKPEEEPKKEPEPVVCKSKRANEIRPSTYRPVTPGDYIDLEVIGGSLCTGSKWSWYEEACPSKTKQQPNYIGKKITVSPSRTTTYYVRAEGKNDITACAAFKVVVEERKVSTEADVDPPEKKRETIKIEGAPKYVICPGELISLRVSGGINGSEKNWVWYENGCGIKGKFITSGVNMITIRPEKTTTIYVKDLNDTEVLECKSITIQVKPITKLPSLEINYKANRVSVCTGELVSLQVTNSTIPSTMMIKWYTDTLSGPIHNNKYYSFQPSNSANIFVRGEGECGILTEFSRIYVEVREPPKAPIIIYQREGKGKNYTLELAGGGPLSSSERWVWYKGYVPQGASIGRGTMITHNVREGKTVSVRAEGGTCGPSPSKSYTIDAVSSRPKTTGFFNVGVVTPSLTNLSITAGINSLYVRYKTSLSSQAASYDITTNSASQYIIPNYPIYTIDYYEFNGLKKIKRSGFTGGMLIGKKSFRLYVGAGIGEVSPQWGVNIVSYSDPSFINSKWGTLLSEQRKGLEAEAGLFMKLGSINIMGGVSAINDRNNGTYIDGSVGIGLSF